MTVVNEAGYKIFSDIDYRTKLEETITVYQIFEYMRISRLDKIEEFNNKAVDFVNTLNTSEIQKICNYIVAEGLTGNKVSVFDALKMFGYSLSLSGMKDTTAIFCNNINCERLTRNPTYYCSAYCKYFDENIFKYKDSYDSKEIK